jgi:hypothetical protein
MRGLRISWGRHAEMLGSVKKCDFLKNLKNGRENVEIVGKFFFSFFLKL